MQRVLGIDLGTTNSVVACIRRGEPEVLPNGRNEESTYSVVARGRRGELLVGTAARGRAGVDEADVIRSIKRFMGRHYASPDVQAVLRRVKYDVVAGDGDEVNVRFAGRAYSPTEISSLILGRLKADAEKRLGAEFPRAVITVPAYFGERQVAATREAGRMAGFHVLKVLDEPTAAALAYGYLREATDEDQTILVFDMGGGTFDISVLMLIGGVIQVLCVEGDNLLGGDDFDRLVVDRVLDATRAERGIELSTDRAAVHNLVVAAEEAKIDLSDVEDAEIILPAPFAVEYGLSRAEFTELISPRIDGAMALVDRAVAGAHLSHDDIDKVLLVGGSTAIPYVEERLAAVFGRDKIRKEVHPMKAVALGAAIQGSLVSEIECPACGVTSPVAAEECTGCGQSFRPPATIACPHCHLYAEVPDSECPKCGGNLAGGPPPPRPAPSSTDPTEGGLRCSSCKAVNVAGATECAECHEPFGPPGEITPQDFGIEVDDGSMAVVLPKGTTFPTPEDVPREFATAVTDQRRLEIAVYEGAQAQAQSNELCGYVTLALPPGLPRNSPITVSFGLNASRILTVSVRVRALGEEPRRVTIQRGTRLDAHDQQRLASHRRRITVFVDKWNHELTAAESAVFYQMIAELDELIAGGTATRARVDEVAGRSDRLVEMAGELRGRDAFLSAVENTIGKYLPPAERSDLEEFRTAIAAARERADWGSGRLVAEQAEQAVDDYGPEWRNFVYCRTFATQGKLSPALGHRVLEQVRAFDTAYDENDEEGRNVAMGALLALSAEVAEEIHGLPDDEVGEVRPTVKGS